MSLQARRIFTLLPRRGILGSSVGYRSTATARTTQALWCLREPAWLLPPTNPALARPWDRQPGSPAHRSRMHVGSATGYRRPLAHRPSAARQFRSGPRPLSPTSPPCTHLTLGYSPKLVEKLLGEWASGERGSRKPGLPYARRSFGICQSLPRVGKHYQNYDEDGHYLQHCDKGLQCGAWRKDYPRRSQKEVERTNNDGGPVAPWFEHP